MSEHDQDQFEKLASECRRRYVLNGLHCLSVVTTFFGGIIGANAQQSPSAQRGAMLARANCARCHAVDKVSPSPLAIAPPFRILHKRYPVETLEEALGEGIVTGHNNMPEFKLELDQVRDFINFLKSPTQ